MLIVLIIVIWVIKGAFFQPSAEALKAGPIEHAKYRNENNTGPIQHIYVVSVKDSIWKDLETYGNYKPHHKGGNTKVYYFMEGSQMPDKLLPGNVNFHPALNKNCIAMYEKSAMGNVSLTKYPYRQSE